MELDRVRFVFSRPGSTSRTPPDAKQTVKALRWILLVLRLKRLPSSPVKTWDLGLGRQMSPFCLRQVPPTKHP
jgi:hypothetical protein